MKPLSILEGGGEPDSIDRRWQNFTRGIVKSFPLVGALLEQLVYGTLDATEHAVEIAEFRKNLAEIKQSAAGQSVLVEELVLLVRERWTRSGRKEPKLDELISATRETNVDALPRDIRSAFEAFLAERSEGLAGVVIVPFNVPHPRNPVFTGREELLGDLREVLSRDGPAALSQPQAMSGLGGIGKTQAAVEYAYRYRDEYRAVLWSGAEARDALVSGFAAVARLLELPERDEQDLAVVVKAVKRWLETHREWLLILDNAEDLNILGDFMPPNSAGHLLLTTRLRATGTIAQRVELTKMEPSEGSLFLLRRAKIIEGDAALEDASEADRGLAAEILEEVDGLPLALDQAGAFIEETPSSLAEYLELYRAGGATLRAKRGELAGDHDSVTVTFSLAFEQVSKKSAAAADLVRLCAFLAPDAIPEEIFREGAEHLGEDLGGAAAEPLQFIEALEMAGRFSLVGRNPGDKTLDMHRLVQAVVRDAMDAETRRLWAERAVNALNETFPRPEYRNWAQCERLRSHGLAAAEFLKSQRIDSEASAELLGKLGRYLFDRALYQEAEPLLQCSLAIKERTLGLDHPSVATTLNNLVELYRSQGRYEEAEPLYQRSLAIKEKALGPDHPEVATTLNNLAGLYRSQGRYEEAEPLYQRSLAIKEKALGPDHPEVATTLNNLAGLYESQGRYEEAEPLYQRCLAISEKALGPDHPSVATTLNNLGQLYRSQGRYEEAGPLYHRSLAIKEKALGPDHLEVATTLNNLGELYRSQGRYEEAEPLYQRSLAISEKALGPDHPSVATTLNNLAGLYRSQGRYEEAEPLYQRSLAIKEKTLGPDHPSVATTLNNLGELYRSQGRYEEAEPLYQRSLAIKEKALGPEHPSVAATLNNLALLYKRQGRYEEAEPLYQRSLAIKEKALGPDHPEVATTLNNLAGLYESQGRYEEAEPLYQRSLAILEKVLGPRHPNTAAGVKNYAGLLRTMGRGEEAAALEAGAKRASSGG